jgi:DhnA family fructose-bisphosphate aldolase class Ia
MSYRIDDNDFRMLIDVRARTPERIGDAADRRRRRPLLAEDGRLFIIAADHPARAIFKVGSNPRAMQNRRELLGRILTALELPGVDGVMATPDILEDLLLLGALEERVAVGSMNRSGLTGSAWELDDRFTAYDVPALVESGLDGGKMLLRINLEDPASNRTIEACAHAVSHLARARMLAMVEPLAVHRAADGSVALAKDADSLIGAVCVAAGLGTSSAYTWLKLPTVEEMERVVASTTLPVLLLGGNPGARAEEVVAGWRRALEIPQVRGLVAGRALLYPEDDDVSQAVARAAEMVHG